MSSLSAKKGSKRTVEKYSSKFTGAIIDGIVTESVSDLPKNAKTTEKWLGKMKLSILRKISAGSKKAFLTEEQRPEYLKSEIEKEQEKIRKQTQNIKSAAAHAFERSKLSQVSIVATHTKSSESKLNTRVEDIGSKLQNVAHQLKSTSKETTERINSLKSTLKEVGDNWQKHSQNSSNGIDEGIQEVKRGRGRPKKSVENMDSLGLLEGHLVNP